MTFTVEVDVLPKEGIADPQGTTVERALPGLGFAGVSGVRVGRHIVFRVEAPDLAAAEDLVRRACERFLANPVIEDFTIEVRAAQGVRG